jgi:hypothetical protein
MVQMPNAEELGAIDLSALPVHTQIRGAINVGCRENGDAPGLFILKLKCSYFSSPAAAFCSSSRKGPICLASSLSDSRIQNPD